MRASDIDFSTINHFHQGEFPAIAGRSVLEFTDADLVRALDTLRSRLGHSITPSPVTAGWVREGGSRGSQHYIGQITIEDGEAQSQRLSTAGDIFPNCDVRDALIEALGMPEFGGIGVYLDTTGPRGTFQPMMHVDIRTGPRQLWIRYDGQYVYPAKGEGEMDFFFSKLAEV